MQAGAHSLDVGVESLVSNMYLSSSLPFYVPILFTLFTCRMNESGVVGVVTADTHGFCLVGTLPVLLVLVY